MRGLLAEHFLLGFAFAAAGAVGNALRIAHGNLVVAARGEAQASDQTGDRLTQRRVDNFGAKLTKKRGLGLDPRTSLWASED